MDHKVIGIQYLLTAMVMALVAGGLAAVIRIQLAWPSLGIVSPETYLSVVTLHGTLMVFFVISLGLLSGMGNFLIPLHVGARDMAYPLLNMLSYWVIVPACALMVGSFFVEGGAAASGWTAYPPLSALKEAVPGSHLGQTLWLLAMALFIVSFTMGGLNYLTTILNLRAPGMSMMRLPLSTWTFLISTILGLLAFPALTAAAIMLLFDRHLGTSFFLPSGMVIGGKVLPHDGGTPLLFQHLFWFLGHPEVYVVSLPALGIAFDVLAAFARRPVFGYRVSVYALLVIAVLSMIVWGHHMFTTGMNPYLGEYFTLVTVMITVPFSVLGLNLIATLWRARIRIASPMLFALGVISAIGIGGLGGLFLGTAASDIHFQETFFVVGHFHFTIGAVTFFGLFTGIYFWFPKMFGRLLDERLARVHFWLTIVPMFAGFLLMHYQGLGHLLRRTYDSAYSFQKPVTGLHPLISVLAFATMAGQFVFLVNFVKSACWGARAEANPWRAASLEWTTASPAPHGNWGELDPVVHGGPYEYGANGTAEDFVSQTAAGERA
ncbi:MAG: cbb3-type cytochrome c oxidase subunit I [Planctomycetes bacterium]|nr:cbb3-type cytochrome c oxidase subunit I [Planctomycetota bacterium]